MKQPQIGPWLPILLLISFWTAAGAPASAQYGGYCGDGFCNGSEDYYSCAPDCAYCGDLFCSPGEDTSSCYMDCAQAYCGDGICNNSETLGSCAADCSGPPPPPTCQPETCGTCNRPGFGADGDSDSVPDQLEYDLAHAFFPSVMLKDVESDLQQAYLHRGNAIPYTVEAIPPSGICSEAYQCLEIRYGLAYIRDYGDSIAAGHLGDSEFYAVLVMRNQSWPIAQSSSGSWQMIRDFTAAHWGESGADSSVYGAYSSCPANCHAWDNSEEGCHQRAACGWYPGQCYGGASASYEPCSSYGDEGSCYFAGGSCHWSKSSCFQSQPATCYSSQPMSGYATLYASEKKHALYHSDWECDHGGVKYPWGEGEDECPNTNLYSLRTFKGELLQNVGSRYQPSADRIIQHPDMCSLYDVWVDQPFGGSNVTSYYKHFTRTLSWSLIP
ncbi:MAG: hypothetical protein ABUT39_19760 [Acidobacteriota bacterium]